MLPGVKPSNLAEHRQRRTPSQARRMLVTCPLPCEGSSAKCEYDQTPMLNQCLDSKKQNKSVNYRSYQ